MSDEIDPYQGREHSKIKHLFLADYLQAASFKVLQGPAAAKCFTYVDGFAGPWSVADEEECSDSSFDYAIRVLRDTQAALEKAGRTPPKLRFLLCERDPEQFKKLSAYAARKTGIEIHVFRGAFEDNLQAIRARCEGFTFSFIDPKGWNLRSAEIAAFLASVRGDFVLNFMEHPISRHNSLELVQESFGRFLDDALWHEKISTLPGTPPRAMQILAMLKDRLKSKGAARFMPDFAILKPRADRVQMRLILGTHHAQGVEVFRTVQKKIETVQAETRRTLATGDDPQSSIFPSEALNTMDLDGRGVGGERSLTLARTACIEIMNKADRPVRFEVLAARVMEDAAVRMTNVKDLVVKLRALGLLSFDLDGGAKKPVDATPIRRALTGAAL